LSFTFAKKKENNGKAEEYQFKLVEGQYTTVEAQKILLGL
jgi:hypothetical protein